jgi:hypothetical protein
VQRRNTSTFMAGDAWTTGLAPCHMREAPAPAGLGSRVGKIDMRRVALLVVLCLAHPLTAHADALDDTLQPFCTQSSIAAPACKCAGDVMRRAIPAGEIDVILKFARNQLSAGEADKLPDGGAALRAKFVDGWRQAQAECGVKQ